jgi:hypothetical protein
VKVANSELATFRRCQRKWWLAFYRRLVPKRDNPTGARGIGTRVHEALEALYDPEAPRDPIVVFDEGVRRSLEEHPELKEDLVKDADLGRAMIEGYLEWLATEGVDQDLEVISVEEALEEQLTVLPESYGSEPIIVVGKLDQRIRRSDGVHLFLDHKTVGDLSRPIKTLHLDTQMKMYHLLEYLRFLREQRPLEERTDGGLYNMLRKVKRTVKANPPFFARYEVRHNIDELRSYWYEVYGVAKEIWRRKLLLDGGLDHRIAVPPTPRPECSWDCDFLAICAMLDDGSDVEAVIDQAYTVGDPYARYEIKGGGD